MTSDNHDDDRDLSFSALRDVIAGCKNDEEIIKERRASIQARIREAALHGIDPAAVRRLLLRAKKNEIDLDRNDEIDAIYKAIVEGGVPVLPTRSDIELDRVLALADSDKPPKIATIKEALGCSQGKAQRLRTLAAARLLAKSSSSREIDEHELLTKQEEASGAPPVGELQESQIEPHECEAANKAPVTEERASGESAEPPREVEGDDLEFPDFLRRGTRANGQAMRDVTAGDVVVADRTDKSAYTEGR